MNDRERILVRSVNWLGDAIMTIPALFRLREARPDAEITLLTHEKLATLWTSQAFLDHVLTFKSEENWWTVGRRLRPGNYHCALVFPNSLRSALEVFCARIPIRIGRTCLERNLFLTDRIHVPIPFPTRKASLREIHRRLAHPPPAKEIPSSAHHIHHYLALTAALGASTEPLPPRLEISPADLEFVRRKFALNTSSPIIGINPGAEYGLAKRWPPERFAASIHELANRTGATILLFGGAADVPLVHDIINRAATSNIRNLAGQTTLPELCALLKHCDLLVTNDTGPMHVAAAVGTSVIVPFGSTSPELTGPGLPGNETAIILRTGAPCAPCFLRECPIDFRCMAGVSVQQVLNAVMRELSNRARVE